VSNPLTWMIFWLVRVDLGGKCVTSESPIHPERQESTCNALGNYRQLLLSNKVYPAICQVVHCAGDLDGPFLLRLFQDWTAPEDRGDSQLDVCQSYSINIGCGSVCPLWLFRESGAPSNS
jgi:hypothetical protein